MVCTAPYKPATVKERAFLWALARGIQCIRACMAIRSLHLSNLSKKQRSGT